MVAAASASGAPIASAAAGQTGGPGGAGRRNLFGARRGGAGDRPATVRNASRGPGGPATRGHEGPGGSSPHRAKDTSTLEELSSVGLKTASHFAFPLILALLVVAFLTVQSRIDRNDPKLRLAPIDSKHDLLRFN